MKKILGKPWCYWHKEGKWIYIILTGITWGILTACIAPVFVLIFEGSLTTTNLLETYANLELELMAYPICGIAFGWWMWYQQDSNYRNTPKEYRN